MMYVIVMFSYLVCQKVESLKLHLIRTNDFIVLSQSCSIYDLIGYPRNTILYTINYKYLY